jgi:DNA-binding MarR family transcriptional regulator
VTPERSETVAKLDKIIHERARLRIVTYLASRSADETSFTELQEKLEFSSGNLSIQLKKLKEAGYVEIHKTFKDNKPFTTIVLTAKGSEALFEYVNEMEELIGALKQNK